MKKIATFCVFLFINNLFLFSQVIIDGEAIDGSTFSKIYNNILPAKTKHLNAKSWVAKTFGDYKSVIQFEDNENYKLIIKGKILLPPIHNIYEEPITWEQHSDRDISFIMTIDSRDEKYRVIIEEITLNLDSYTDFGVFRNSEVTHKLINEYCTPPDTTFVQRRLDSINMEIVHKEEMYYLQSQEDIENMKQGELKAHQSLLDTIQAQIIELEKERSRCLNHKTNIFKSANERCLEMSTPINIMLLSLSKAMEVDDDF